ncbi:hypothetical protein DFH09DRAFT_1414501 [Mycena vulgaris]|nr:hypothetical protein DFH09DRAFT_1414501 [Mycena vulgaris]
MSETTVPAAAPAPTSAASPPAPTPTVPAEPAPPVTTAAPEMPAQTTADTPAPPQPGATPVPPTAEPTPAPAAAPEIPEPQNALTEKFTGYEWKALAEFRKTVPDSLAKGYTEKPDARTAPITLWGVQIDPANLVDARVSVVLMKFLRARTLNVTAASEMFVETLRWRDEFKVDSALKEEFPADVFGKLGHIFGRDKEGRPVVYNVYGGNSDLDAVFGDIDRFLRWRVAFMESDPGPRHIPPPASCLNRGGIHSYIVILSLLESALTNTTTKVLIEAIVFASTACIIRYTSPMLLTNILVAAIIDTVQTHFEAVLP